MPAWSPSQGTSCPGSPMQVRSNPLAYDGTTAWWTTASPTALAFCLRPLTVTTGS